MTYLTERDLASRWRCSIRHVQNARTAGRIDHLRLGRRVLYSVEAVERYEREQTTEAVTVTMKRRA